MPLTRNRILIAGAALLLVLGLVGAGVWQLLAGLERPSTSGAKPLVTRLGYCGPDELRPCIDSFSQAGSGAMFVRIRLPTGGYPAADLLVRLEGLSYQYDCQLEKEALAELVCAGPEMFPGAWLELSLIARSDQRVLAEGQFALIGLMLGTPLAEGTQGGLAALTFEETPTPFTLEVLPPMDGTPTETPTPTATLTAEAYPNPSYPNPSYPNP